MSTVPEVRVASIIRMVAVEIETSLDEVTVERTLSLAEALKGLDITLTEAEADI